MFGTLKWAVNAILHGQMLVNRMYTEEERIFIPGVDKPVTMQPGDRVEIIYYPRRK